MLRSMCRNNFNIADTFTTNPKAYLTIVQSGQTTTFTVSFQIIIHDSIIAKRLS